jgi:hypothetical protein
VDANQGTVVTITKRGRPLATVQVAKKSEWRSLEGILAGKIDIDALGDIVSPRTDVHWDALEGILDPTDSETSTKALPINTMTVLRQNVIISNPWRSCCDSSVVLPQTQ